MDDRGITLLLYPVVDFTQRSGLYFRNGYNFEVV